MTCVGKYSQWKEQTTRKNNQQMEGLTPNRVHMGHTGSNYNLCIEHAKIISAFKGAVLMDNFGFEGSRLE